MGKSIRIKMRMEDEFSLMEAAVGKGQVFLESMQGSYYTFLVESNDPASVITPLKNAGVEFVVVKGATPDEEDINQSYVNTTDAQIDVVAINSANRIVYICEVATHLITGLQYVKNKTVEVG